MEINIDYLYIIALNCGNVFDGHLLIEKYCEWFETVKNYLNDIDGYLLIEKHCKWFETTAIMYIDCIPL